MFKAKEKGIEPPGPFQIRENICIYVVVVVLTLSVNIDVVEDIICTTIRIGQVIKAISFVSVILIRVASLPFYASVLDVKSGRGIPCAAGLYPVDAAGRGTFYSVYYNLLFSSLLTSKNVLQNQYS